MFKEPDFMRDLEERRAEHAKKLEGLSAAESARIYEEEGEKAYKAMGLTIPKVNRNRPAAA